MSVKSVASVSVRGAMSQLAGPIIKSPLNKREYRGLTLPNKMKVLLIHDSETDISAASMSVSAGSMCDPLELPGLAHFCEHMLFLGTEKYPVENDYAKFLTENGGDSNAYTDRDHTNYYFSVSPQSLKGALDRFAQFFIAPLFTESATEREVNAVNSEHEKNIPEDESRNYHMELVAADKNHPYSHFPTGNRNTLWNIPKSKGVDVRKALLDFHGKYYSANMMNLAVLGIEPLDELQEIVEQLFTSVENRDVEIPIWKESAHGPNELQRRIELVPVKDVRWLMLTFPTPDPTPFYKSRPSGYVSHLIGHEGPGSLLSLLKKKELVNSLTAGPYAPARGMGIFQVGVDLTEKGNENTDLVVEYIFQYIRMLKDLGPQKWIWEEKRDIGNILFHYEDKQNPQGYVEHLSSDMINYPIEEILSKSLLKEYNPDLINEYLNFLTPQNAQVQIVSRSCASNCKTVEEYYGVKYNISNIPEELIGKWSACKIDAALRLPQRNEFIPSEFDQKPREEKNWGIIPRIISDTPLSRIWFLQDNEFSLPKVVLEVDFRSPMPLEKPLNAALNHMLVEMIDDFLTEESYAADLADLSYSVENSSYGISISVDGYHHKLPILLDKVISKLINFEIINLERFEILKEDYLRDLKNWDDEQPSSQIDDYVGWVLNEKGFLPPEILQVMDDVTIPNLKNYVKEFLSKINLQWLIYGNLTSEEALSWAKPYEGILRNRGSQSVTVNRLRQVELPEGSDLVYANETKNHSSSCSSVIFQCGVEEIRRSVILDMVIQIASEPCFDQLRTKEQLGYVVYSYARRSCGVQGLQITVQGDRHPSYVESRIENFLNNLGKTLEDMTSEEFEQHKSALNVKLAEKPKRMTARGALIWVQIKIQQYNFNHQEMELKELETITLNDVVEFYKEMVVAENRRKISFRIISMAEGGAGHKKALNNLETDGKNVISETKEEIKNVPDWKRQRKLFHLPKSYLD